MSDPEQQADEAQPDDESPEADSPMVVFDSGEGRVADTIDPPQGSALQNAFDCLEIRVPIDELRDFGEKRIQTLIRLNETEKAGLIKDALDEGMRAIRQVMGARASEEAR